jgi:general secretion pathway protein C
LTKMQAISLERSNIAQTAAVALVTFVALVLLGLVLAYWTWVWLAPRLEPRAMETAQTSSRLAGPTQGAYGLFGNAQRERSGAVPAGIAVRLLGVVAATGSLSAYAVVQLDATQILAVRAGDNLAAGVRLAEVHADRVILDRNGVRETLAFPERNAPLGPAVPATNK